MGLVGDTAPLILAVDADPDGRAATERELRKRYRADYGVDCADSAASGIAALLETSLPGVFAAGDVRHGSAKRVAAAVGEGALAIQLCHGFLAQAPEAVR